MRTTAFDQGVVVATTFAAHAAGMVACILQCCRTVDSQWLALASAIESISSNRLLMRQNS